MNDINGCFALDLESCRLRTTLVYTFIAGNVLCSLVEDLPSIEPAVRPSHSYLNLEIHKTIIKIMNKKEASLTTTRARGETHPYLTTYTPPSKLSQDQ